MPDDSDKEDQLTGGEAARLLGVTRQHINRLAHDGKIPARQVAGRFWLFRRIDIEAYRLQVKDKGGRPRKADQHVTTGNNRETNTEQGNS